VSLFNKFGIIKKAINHNAVSCLINLSNALGDSTDFLLANIEDESDIYT